MNVRSQMPTLCCLCPKRSGVSVIAGRDGEDHPDVSKIWLTEHRIGNIPHDPLALGVAQVVKLIGDNYEPISITANLLVRDLRLRQMLPQGGVELLDVSRLRQSSFS